MTNSEDGVDKSTDDESFDGRYFCTQYPNNTSKGSIYAGEDIDSTTMCGNENDKQGFLLTSVKMMCHKIRIIIPTTKLTLMLALIEVYII